MSKKRMLEFTSPLGDGVLILERMTAVERLGRPFELELELVSPDQEVKLEDILGQNVTATLHLGDKRHFNGHVSRFTQLRSSGRFAAYHATVRPWLWFLTHASDCRIFQETTVPDIVKQVFRDHGFTDFEEKLSGEYRTWEYCVQYRESDFDFVSRLMEHEGIYYFFEHTEDKHTLVLADSYSSHDMIPGYDQVPYAPDTSRRDHVSDWKLTQQVVTGSCALDSFDFERPKASLAVKSSIPRDHTLGKFEVYDYPGPYLETSDGDNYARARIEAVHAGYETVEGECTLRAFRPGGLFKLSDHPRDDQNREYLIVSTNCELQEPEDLASGGGGGDPFSCKFTAIDSEQPFRPRQVTPKPVVRGPQTAVVVGKSGEEVWTDKYGRVKVQFHWDREGKGDEKSSCWVRVAQATAGKGWGQVQVPRTGQEVVVDFLEGDPDRPIVTGRVYNADAMPPYELPANALVSGFKSSSSGGSCELRIADSEDSEQIYLHSQKDLDVRIENDDRELIGNDRHLTVANDRKTSIGADDHLAVGGDLNVEAGGDTNLKSGGDHNQETATKFSIDAGTEIHGKAGTSIAIEGGTDVHIKGGANVVVEGTAGLTLKVGGSFVFVGPAGVDISGPLVKINSGGAAGSGSGASPGSAEAPAEPEEPNDPE